MQSEYELLLNMKDIAEDKISKVERLIEFKDSIQLITGYTEDEMMIKETELMKSIGYELYELDKTFKEFNVLIRGLVRRENIDIGGFEFPELY